MSRTSKLKKQIKGYVRARQLEYARQEGNRSGFRDGLRDGYRNGYDARTEELTLYVVAPEGSYLLGEQPKQPFVKVAVAPRGFGATAMLDVRDERMRFFPPNVTTIAFRARRQSFALPDGRNVVWWDWEPAR